MSRVQKKTNTMASKNSTGRVSKIRDRFATEYLVDLNGAAAARRAGWPAKSAAKAAWAALQDPAVQKLIQQRMDERSARTEITVDQVLRDLREVADVCMARLKKPDIVLSPEGEVIMDRAVKSFDAHGAIQALTKIGQHLEMFTEKHKIDASDELKSFLDRISGKSISVKE